MRLINNIPVWGDPVDEGALRQITLCAKDAAHCALMADHHVGYAVPIGGVLAYTSKISPSGVGFDIGCGNLACLTNLTFSDIKNDIPKIADDIFSQISFGIGQKNQIKVDDPLFDDPAWKLPVVSKLKSLAESQLGTVGSGNHYVDIFKDEKDRIWIGVHFGSRGLGHRIATYFLSLAGAKDGIDVEPVLLNVGVPSGEDYLQAMQLAGRYAYAGREWVCSKVAEIMGAQIKERVHNHHNYIWREKHGEEYFWVVRKGATPAFPGQRGFVGGSMGDISVIISGLEHPLARQSLYSTIHGAGRVMSRTQARGKINRRTGKVLSPGKIRREMMLRWIQDFNKVELRGAGVDESPHCYKRIEDVLEYHKGTIKIDHILYPLIVCMAGADEFDPYKD